MKQTLFAMVAVFVLLGCSPHAANAPNPFDQSARASRAVTVDEGNSTVAAPAAPLPFRIQLAEGDPSELTPVLAASLTKKSVITFTYREELTHDDYHIPRIITAIDPVTYFGAPLGDYGVTAFASLTIYDGEQVIGDYTAKVRISKSYTLYKEITHAEVEQAARDAVRKKIDDQLNRDATRLAQAAKGEPKPQAGPLDR